MVDYVTHVLFVCTGNICRSPFAERYSALLAASGTLPADWVFSSAGIGAVVDSEMDAEMARELIERGGTPEGFRARQMRHAVLDGVDWIIAMEASQRQWLLEEYPGRLRQTFTLGQLVAALPHVPTERVGEAVLVEVGEHRTRARGRDDVPDPYLRGTTAAESAAQRIVADLTAIAARIQGLPD